MRIAWSIHEFTWHVNGTALVMLGQHQLRLPAQPCVTCKMNAGPYGWVCGGVGGGCYLPGPGRGRWTSQSICTCPCSLRPPALPRGGTHRHTWACRDVCCRLSRSHPVVGTGCVQTCMSGGQGEGWDAQLAVVPGALPRQLTVPSQIRKTIRTSILSRRQNSSRPWAFVLTIAALTHWLTHCCVLRAVSTVGQASCARPPTRKTARGGKASARVAWPVQALTHKGPVQALTLYVTPRARQARRRSPDKKNTSASDPAMLNDEN